MRKLYELKGFYDMQKIHPQANLTVHGAIIPIGFIFLMNIGLCFVRISLFSIVIAILMGIVFLFTAIFAILRRAEIKNKNYCVNVSITIILIMSLALTIISISATVVKISPWIYFVATLLSLLAGAAVNYIKAIRYVRNKNPKNNKTNNIYIGIVVGFSAYLISYRILKRLNPSPEQVVGILWICVPIISFFAGYLLLSVLCKHYLNKMHIEKE